MVFRKTVCLVLQGVCKEMRHFNSRKHSVSNCPCSLAPLLSHGADLKRTPEQTTKQQSPFCKKGPMQLHMPTTKSICIEAFVFALVLVTFLGNSLLASCLRTTHRLSQEVEMRGTHYNPGGGSILGGPPTQ